jgi:uncharacterized membrane protein YuzA (DUF378 family)
MPINPLVLQAQNINKRRRFIMRIFKTLSKFDKLTLGLATLGAINWGVAGLARRDALGGAYIKRSPARGLYGLMGLAGIYQIIRTTAPKTKHERRRDAFDQALLRLEDTYDKLGAMLDEGRQSLDKAGRRAEHYRRSAKNLAEKPRHLLKSA